MAPSEVYFTRNQSKDQSVQFVGGQGEWDKAEYRNNTSHE